MVGVTFLAQVTTLVFSIAAGAIVARVLGREGKGIVGLALLLPGMLGLFLGAGVGAANVYYAGSRRLDVSSLVGNSMALGIVGSLVGLVIVGILAATGGLERLVRGVPAWLLLLGMAAVPSGLIGNYFKSILMGIQRLIAVNIVQFACGFLALALTLVFIVALGLGPLGAVLASLSSGLVGLLAMASLLRREAGGFRPRWDRSVLSCTLFFGLRCHVGNMLQFFNYRLDVFILNSFLGPAAVGVYGVSVALAELLWYLPNSVSFVIFPKAASTRPEAMNLFTPRVFLVTLVLTALGGAGLAVVGKRLIEIVYSTAFAGAYWPMIALLPGVILLGSARVLTNDIAGRGYPEYNSITAGVGLVLTIVFDLVLIPQHGILGAALASSIAYTAIFLTAIVFYLIVSRKARVRSAVPGGEVEVGAA